MSSVPDAKASPPAVVPEVTLRGRDGRSQRVRLIGLAQTANRLANFVEGVERPASFSTTIPTRSVADHVCAMTEALAPLRELAAGFPVLSIDATRLPRALLHAADEQERFQRRILSSLPVPYDPDAGIERALTAYSPPDIPPDCWHDRNELPIPSRPVARPVSQRPTRATRRAQARRTRLRELHAQGMVIKQIARELGCSERTIYNDLTDLQ